MSDLPTKKRTQPFSQDEFRLKLLKNAGVDDPRLISLVKKVVDSAEAELEATKITPITDHGRVTDQFEQPDYGARAKARDQLIEVIGLKRNSSGDKGASGVTVNITPPAWLQKPSVSVQSAPQVIDASVVSESALPPVSENIETNELSD